MLSYCIFIEENALEESIIIELGKVVSFHSHEIIWAGWSMLLLLEFPMTYFVLQLYIYIYYHWMDDDDCDDGDDGDRNRDYR